MKSPRFTSPRFWGLTFLAWFILLNLLSHGDRFHPPSPFQFNIPHLDKFLHFGYFFGGGGLLGATLFLWKNFSSIQLVIIVTIILSLIGVWDEYHQSFFMNRTGNDFGDWLADTLGALTGVLVFRAVHHRFPFLQRQKIAPPVR